MIGITQWLSMTTVLERVKSIFPKVLVLACILERVILWKYIFREL